MTRVLVTGATGFIGRVLCEHLARSGHTVRVALRGRRPLPAGVAECTLVGEIGSATAWETALRDVELVVHAAARTHVLHADPGGATHYAEVNAAGTRRLAQAAVAAGVRRFVYLSSIKVNGEATRGRPYTAADPPAPADDYGRSKLQGETWLTQAAASGGMQAAIVRPPLVYGPGVGANFLRLMRWVDGRRPLPFGAIRNRRSLVNVWNLADLIAVLLARPGAVHGVWLMSDGEDCSTPELIQHLGRALQRPVRLLAVPVPLLRLAATLSGRGREAARLCDSLAVDDGPTRAALGWRPPVAMDEALAHTAAWFRAGAGR